MAYNATVEKLEMPDRIRRLPISDGGFPVPRFVEWIDGKPDFRVIDGRHMARCVKQHVCWICGDKMGRHLSFPIGPMCAINRTTSEPPSHLECARFAARACPFLTQPRMRRNTKELPADGQQPAGIHLDRNPGATCIWTTGNYRVTRAGDGVLFRIGEPTHVEWWALGRTATRDEVMAAINSGLPLLREIAEQDGGAAVATLEKMVRHGLTFVPAGDA